MAVPSAKKSDQVVHDLDGMSTKPNATAGIELRATRRRSSTTKPALAPIKTGLEKDMTADGPQDLKLTRKRAARACDQCRRRKSRCDGQMNCSACKVVGLHCSYGHTIKQSRGPSYVAHLEKKVQELEERLKTTTCGASETGAGMIESASQSPRQDISSTAQCSPTTSDWAGLPFSACPLASDQFGFIGTATAQECSGKSTTYLSTITNEPRGKPVGHDILRQLWNYCNSSSPSQTLESSLKLVQALDTPFPANASIVNAAPLLPPKTEVIRWVGLAFTEIWPFVSRIHAQVIIYRLYNTSTFGQEENDKDDLALLYALLALGQRFDTAKNVDVTDCRTQGIQYFSAAQNMVPLQNCDRSVSALQTIVCLALYLKAGSALTRCHAYVSAAASAGFRMGLHEPVSCFAEDEDAIQRRVWATIRCLDILTSSLLGIPRIVSTIPNDDEPFPCQTSGYESDLLTTSANVQLTRILCRALENVYHGKGATKICETGHLAVREDSMQQVCNELDFWVKNCPMLTTPIENMTKNQLLLLYAHSNAELILFSPFVHHLSNAPANCSSTEYAYACRAFQAALAAVRIADVLHKHLWLHEAYFHVLDVLAFAGVVLLTAERICSDSRMLIEAVPCTKRVKELLLLLSLQNPTAKEIWTFLESADMHADAPSRNASITRPSTLYSQDSGIDVVSPPGSCFNPSPLLMDNDLAPFPMLAEVDSVMG